MKKLMLILGLTAFTSLMACEICDLRAEAKAKVDYTYRLWKIEHDAHGETTKAEKLKKDNEKAWKELRAAQALPISHKGN